MALKCKINAETYAALPDVLKAEYKANGDNFVLDTDDAAELIAARDREKSEKEAAKQKAADLETELNTIKKANGDFSAIEESYKAKVAGLEKQLGEVNTTLTTERRDRYVSAEATKIAKNFTVPSLVEGVIAKRLDVDPRDGKTVRVLDKDGKPTALTVADLQKEFVDNPEYKAIVIAGKGSGSADPARASGAQFPTMNNPTGQPVKTLADMSPQEIAAHRAAKRDNANA